MNDTELKDTELKDTELKDTELVYNKEDGKIMAGGYLVNSLLLNEGKPATYSNEEGLLHGGKGKFSDRFKHLAVPAGLLYIQSKSIQSKSIQSKSIQSKSIQSKSIPVQSKSIQSKPIQSKSIPIQSNDDDVVNDELYEKLLKLAYENKEADNKQKTTKKRKAKKPIKNKTKSKRK
jgi:hypothetical protein